MPHAVEELGQVERVSDSDAPRVRRTGASSRRK